jgi:catechol 2,3-dioxygenase-like lactoylglutathione lyase family enzyme
MLRPALAVLAAAAICATLAVIAAPASAQPQLPPPRFHHIELNSVDPDAAIAFYVKQFPATARTVWEGKPALASPDNVLVVFNKVPRPPAADPNVTAYWHFGWNVVDSHRSMEAWGAQNLLVPFYTDEQGDFVGISSDTYPYPPGVPGRTRAQLAEAKAQNLQPRREAGNGYIAGPDGAIIEFTGNAPAERIDHVHMWQEDPVCAQLWYQAHLLATPRRAGRGDSAPLPGAADCKQARTPELSWPSLTREGTYRAPTGGVSFSGVNMNWYPNQGGKPLAPTAGRLMDHIGLAVGDLDAWIAKLRGEGVTFLRPPYRTGATRAVMLEGPSHEAIELVEVK